jgi:methionine-S-sulfoxide reductase
MGETDEERCAGFLHEVIERSDWTADRLRQAGVHESVVNAVELLTRPESLPYDEYIQHIIDSHNPIALQVKFNDLTESRNRDKSDPDLQLRHNQALKQITQALERLNGVSLYDAKQALSAGRAIAVFAAGCFWGVQHYMERQSGVLQTYVGYTGGTEERPTYDEVRKHHTRHLESVLVEFDPKVTTFDTLCRLFFEIHDPAQTDGQGPDIGDQYRSAIFYCDEEQKAISLHLMDLLRSLGYEVNTLLQPLGPFWMAEAYHQHYYDHTGGSPYCHVRTRKFPRD